MLFLSIVVIITPEIDLGFALSVAAADAQETFTKLKKTLEIIIDKYGTNKIKYAVLSFAAVPTAELVFQDESPSTDSLKQAIKRIVRPRGEGNLKRLLNEAKRLFGSRFVRPMAKKVLVVAMDKKSTNEMQELKSEATGLNKMGIKIVAVALGKDSDYNELESITSNRGYVIKSPKDHTADRLASKVMGSVLKGKLLYYSLLFN